MILISVNISGMICILEQINISILIKYTDFDLADAPLPQL